jgi:hypothetical protein
LHGAPGADEFTDIGQVYRSTLQMSAGDLAAGMTLRPSCKSALAPDDPVVLGLSMQMRLSRNFWTFRSENWTIHGP